MNGRIVGLKHVKALLDMIVVKLGLRGVTGGVFGVEEIVVLRVGECINKCAVILPLPCLLQGNYAIKSIRGL